MCHIRWGPDAEADRVENAPSLPPPAHLDALALPDVSQVAVVVEQYSPISSEEGTLQKVLKISREIQGQNLALTVVYVPVLTVSYAMTLTVSYVMALAVL